MEFVKMNNDYRKSERGSAGTKFLFFLAIIFLIGNAGINFIPVAYSGENIKQEVNAAVMQGLLVPPTSGTPVDVTKKRIAALMKANDIPENAYVDVKQVNGVLQARVAYNKQISILPFGIYKYNYQFDYTSNSRGF